MEPTAASRQMSYSEILRKVEALAKAKEAAEAKTLQAIRLWSAEREKILAAFERLRAQAVASAEGKNQAQAQLQARLVEIEAQLKIKDAAVQELQREILSLETARHALGGEVDRARASAAESSRRAEEYRQQNEVLKNQRDSIFMRAKEFEKALEAEKHASRDLRASVEMQIADAKSRAELKVRESRLELEMQLREARHQNETRARYIQRLEAEAAELRNQLGIVSGSLQESRASLDRRAAEVDALARELEVKEHRIQSLTDEVTRLQGEAGDSAQRMRAMEMQFLEFSTRIASIEERGKAEVSIREQEIGALKKELIDREREAKERMRRDDREKQSLRGEIDRLKTVFPMRELVTEKRRQVDEVARDLGTLNENHPQRESFVELLRKLEDQRDRLEGVLQAAAAQVPAREAPSS